MTSPVVVREIDGQVIERIVLENRLALRAHVEQLLDDGVRAIVIDLSSCAYVDSSGCGVLVGSTKRVHDRGGKIVLAALNDDVKTLFVLTKLDQIFTISDNVELAIAHLEALEAQQPA